MCLQSTSRTDNRSYHHRERCCGVRVEKICHIFAIVNLIIPSAAALGCIFMNWFFIARFFMAVVHTSISQFIEEFGLLYLIFTVVCVTTAFFGVFAVTLLQGIRKKKPKLIMAYLYFGLGLETVMIMGTAVGAGVVLMATIHQPRHANVYTALGLALAICGCVFYGLILYVVRSTYLVFLSNSKPRNLVDEHTILNMYEA